MKENYKGVINHDKSQQGSKSPQPKPAPDRTDKRKSSDPKPQTPHKNK